MRLRKGLISTGCVLLLLVFGNTRALAQSDLNVSLEDYLKGAGPGVEMVAEGELRIDGVRMRCGRRPTVMDPNFDSWGGAFPGFVILNPKRLEGLATPVKLYVYAHECGHQWVERDEEGADCYAVRRGHNNGWLDDAGMDQICAFIAKLKGDSEHFSGPKRCEIMRRCYKDGAPRAAKSSGWPEN